MFELVLLHKSICICINISLQRKNKSGVVLVKLFCPKRSNYLISMNNGDCYRASRLGNLFNASPPPHPPVRSITVFYYTNNCNSHFLFNSNDYINYSHIFSISKLLRYAFFFSYLNNKKVKTEYLEMYPAAHFS